MRHENTKALFRYWNELRAGRAAPYRSELDPRAISPLLESTFILEHPRAGAPRFRLAGTKLCEQFGMELRGMSALALWHGECRTRVKDLLSEVVRAPRIGHVACTVETRSNQNFEAEFLYLPLRSDLGEMTRIVGCGHYMAPAEAEFAGYEPLHHWIEAVNIYEIDSDELSSSAGKAPGASLDGSARPISQLRDAVARIDARRREQGRKPRRPRLTAIEGGAAAAGSARPLGLQDELERLEDAGRRPDRGHLRLIAGGAENGGGAASSPADRDGAA
ncbi:MAG: PAS domain-containing protein [Pseudomonadota bacterium]